MLRLGSALHNAARGRVNSYRFWEIFTASREIIAVQQVGRPTDEDQSSGGASFGTMSVPSFVMRKETFAFLSQWPPTDRIALPVLVPRRSRSHWLYSAYGPWTNVFRPGGYCSNIQ